MGYSISVDCRSAALQKRMLAFCEAEFKPWNVVLGGDDIDRYISDPTADLSYASHKNQVGFNYGVWGGDDSERFYYWTALRWMALKAGRRRRTIKEDRTHTFAEPQPYTLYDGAEPWPVLLKKPRLKRQLWLWVEPLGLQRNRETLCDRFFGTFMSELISFDPNGKFPSNMMWSEKAVPHLLLGKDGQPIADLLKQRPHLVSEVCWDDLCKLLVPIREEMQRLDDLWEAG